MGCEVVTFCSDSSYLDGIRRAARVLSEGGLVVFPTETVYGVGARGDVPEAVDRLRRVKHRQSDKPFTIHIGRRDEVGRYVTNPGRIGRQWMRKAWPGPLTILFREANPASAPIASQIERSAALSLYHEGVVGLRCPDDSRARDLFNEAAVPVVAASANLADKPPPRTMEEALADLGDDVDLAMDGGPTRLSTPSTVARLDDRGFTILRHGVYGERELTQMARVCYLFVCTGNTCRSPMAAAMFRRMLADRLGASPETLEDYDVDVCSAGTFGSRGASATQAAVDVMSGRGIDLSGHRTRSLVSDLVNRADVIFVMTEGHRRYVLDLVPAAAERCRLVCDTDVEDPAGRPVEVYAACADRLEACLRTKLDEVEP